MRDPELQILLDLMEATLLQRKDYEGRHVAEMVFRALKAEDGAPSTTAATSLPVLDHLPGAIEVGKARPAGVSELAAAFEQLADRLPWKKSRGFDDEAFNAGHANVVLVGTGGLEQRTDFTIGASLAAPHTAYPLHDHPPEELYLTLAGGEFRHGEEDWTPVATGKTFYNTPGIIHSMRALETPLLAIWIFGER